MQWKRAVSSLFFFFIAASVKSQGWTSCETGEPIPPAHASPFEISCWGTTDGQHFFGHGSYAGRRGRFPDDPAPAILHGKWRGNKFFPNVTFQVRRNSDQSWKSVEWSFQGHEALSVSSQELFGRFDIDVDLDPLKRWVGKVRYARIVLETGEAAGFNPSNLLPPDKRPKPGE